MKLLDVILFVTTVCLFIIGIDQAIVLGLSESYWIFMFSLLPLFLYGYRKGQALEKEKQLKKTKKRKKKKK